MPTYQYRCTNGHEFEVMQRMSDDPLTTCQVCGAEVARVLFAPAIHFKGSGFHNTDYGTRRRPVSDDNGSSRTSTSSDGGSTNGSGGGSTSSESGSSSSSGESSGKSVGLDKV